MDGTTSAPTQSECFARIEGLMNQVANKQTEYINTLNVLNLFSYLADPQIFSVIKNSKKPTLGFRRAVCKKALEFMNIEPEVYHLHTELFNKIIELYEYVPLEELVVDINNS